MENETEMEISDDLEAIKCNEQLMVEFTSETGETPFAPFSIAKNVTAAKLKILLEAFKETLRQSRGNDDGQEDDPTQPYLFFINGHEIKTDIAECLKFQLVDTEKTVQIVYQPQAVFRVRPVSRCTSSMPGHTQPVIVASFSPTGKYLASGSGDTTVRLWDLTTETPQFECKGHRQYVLAVSWSPNSQKVASGDKSGSVCLWDPKTGKQVGKTLCGHKQFITALVWEPLHLDGNSRRLGSSSKDGDVRIWDTLTFNCLRSLTGHTMNVTCLRWGGSGLIYSASQDRTIKVWRPDDGILCRTLQGHGHWVNVLALNTDYVMRTGAFDPAKATIVQDDEEDVPADTLKELALKRYRKVLSIVSEELMVSGSDDFTMFLWQPANEKKPLARLTGHQQLVNDVKFSPDARYIVSASFDKSLRLWDGKTGKFLAVLRGHVQAVYQVAWSADSRLIVSGSADSTLKLWSTKNRKMESDLPGHGDEIYTVDWSPDGQRVVSGGKDKVLRIWRS